MSGHTCHARLCTTPCKPEMLMCYAHWKRVPKKLQREVWNHYRAGQCDDKDPSAAWHRAADAAIAAVALKEGCPFGKLRQPEVVALWELARELVPADYHDRVEGFVLRGSYLHGPHACGKDTANGQTFTCGHCKRECCWCLGNDETVERVTGPICNDCWSALPDAVHREIDEKENEHVRTNKT